MSRTSSRSTSVPSRGRANKLVLGFLFALAACGSATFNPYSFVPGQSTLADVEARAGKPAEVQAGANGETVYWYPQLPWSHASYAVRVGADGRLIAVEQRLTEANIKKIVIGRTSMKEVHDLLGPSYMPERHARMERDIWTYPMRMAGHNLPKWFLVQMSTGDGIVRETYLMDDPQFVPMDRGGAGRCC